jgi:tetratricopeptide (TPR) repeat protein
MIRFIFVLLLIAILLLGCSRRRLAVQATLPLISSQIISMQEERDADLAEIAIPASLKMLEGLAKEDPENIWILQKLAEGFCGYAFSFLEDSEPDRASGLYLRGKYYAFRALEIQSNGKTLRRLSLDEWGKRMAEVTPSQQAALFWAGQCWGSWLSLNLDSVEAFSDLPRIDVLMNRAVELDPDFHYAGPHLFLGAYYGGRSRMLGGNPDKARNHFEQALKITEGKYLLISFLYAKTYAVQNQDRNLFKTQLEKVLEASDDVFPEQRLANQIAKRKAAVLLGKIDELF